MEETVQTNKYEIIIVKLHNGVDNALKMHNQRFFMASKLRELKEKNIKINLLFVVCLQNLHFQPRQCAQERIIERQHFQSAL